MAQYVANQTIAIAGTDGVQQHYPAMVFIARWIKNLFNSARHGNFEIPLIDYRIGMRDDILITLNYYGFGDPFYVLSFFFPESAMPWFFTGLFYLRIYFGGVVFLLLAWELVPERSILSYVAGAFLYAFSGFSFEANVHIIFIQAMMYIPLMLYAAERILKDKKWGRRILLCSVCGSACSGFFFTYIGVLATVSYTIIRMVIIEKKGQAPVKMVLAKTLKTGLCIALGLGMASVIFLPAVRGYLNSTRVGGEWNVPLLYSANAYKDMFYTFFIGKELHRSVFSLPVVGGLVLILAMSTKRHGWEKKVVMGSIVGYMLPVFSWIGTGCGSTIYDRWEIVLIIGVSLVFVSMWDKMVELTKRELSFLCVFWGIIVLLGFVDSMFSDRCYRNMFLALSGCMLFLAGSTWWLRDSFLIIRRGIWFSLTLGCIMLTWYTIKSDYKIESVSRDRAAEELIMEDAFCRIENEETFMGVTQINLGMAQNYCSTAEYFSIENPVYITAMDDDWGLALSDGFATSGLDRRAVLESLCGVKYMLLLKEHGYLAPYGFIYRSQTTDEKWAVYENQFALPLAYTYSAVIDYAEYLGMDALEKMMTMCQAAAVKDYQGDIDRWGGNPVYQTERCDIREVREEAYAPDIYSVKVGNTVTLSFPVKENCENYLVVEDKSADGLQEIRWKDSCLSPYMENATANFIHLGYFDKDDEIIIELLIDGESSFDVRQVKAAYIDMSPYPLWLEERASEPLQNIELSANRIKGRIEVFTDKILCTTIPYAKGWRAFVDGEEVPLYQINSLFMGIEIPAGIHEICFSYCTPGMKAGLLITVMSIISVGIWYWKTRNV